MREKTEDGKVRLEFDLVSNRVLSGGNYEICVVVDSEEDQYFSAALLGKIPIPLELQGNLDLRSSSVTLLLIVRHTVDATACFTAKVIN